MWLILLFPFALAAAQCPGGYREGQVLEQDPYWYRCVNTKMMAGGCLDDFRNRVSPNQVFNGVDYAWRCRWTSSGQMTLEMAACLRGDRRIRPGEVMQDGSYCVSDANILKCLLTPDGKAEMTSVGCFFNGEEYKVGETFEDDRFFYTCRRKDGACVAQTLGCTFNNRKMSAFESYQKGSELYRCMFDQDLKRARHVLDGCVKTDTHTGLPLERKLGCVWEDGRAPYVYLSECHNSTGKAEITRIRCKYEGPEGVAEVMPGCWHKLGNLGVGCKLDSRVGMKIVTFNAEDTSRAASYGLSYWLDNLGACIQFRRRK